MSPSKQTALDSLRYQEAFTPFLAYAFPFVLNIEKKVHSFNKVQLTWLLLFEVFLPVSLPVQAQQSYIPSVLILKDSKTPLLFVSLPISFSFIFKKGKVSNGVFYFSK